MVQRILRDIISVGAYSILFSVLLTSVFEKWDTCWTVGLILGTFASLLSDIISKLEEKK